VVTFPACVCVCVWVCMCVCERERARERERERRRERERVCLYMNCWTSRQQYNNAHTHTHSHTHMTIPRESLTRLCGSRDAASRTKVGVKGHVLPAVGAEARCDPIYIYTRERERE